MCACSAAAAGASLGDVAEKHRVDRRRDLERRAATLERDRAADPLSAGVVEKARTHIAARPADRLIIRERRLAGDRDAGSGLSIDAAAISVAARPGVEVRSTVAAFTASRLVEVDRGIAGDGCRGARVDEQRPAKAAAGNAPIGGACERRSRCWRERRSYR